MPHTLTQPVPAAAASANRRPHAPAGLLYAAVALLVAAAWVIVQVTGLRAGSDAGYWTGVAGGVLMLLLFAYPLRKRVRFMARFGAAKWWFVVHMVLGIGGPLMVLVHSTFRVGSLNAGVALYSMLVVAASGIVGRFLYLQLHRGLTGKRESLTHLQRSLGLRQESVHSVLAGSGADKVERLLADFEHHALAGPAGVRRHLAAFTFLPWERRWIEDRCARLLLDAVRARGSVRHWDGATMRHEYRAERQAMRDCLLGVQRVAQFQAATRLFSLWHVLHVPFVYVMVLCAIAHVVAVHAY